MLLFRQRLDRNQLAELRATQLVDGFDFECWPLCTQLLDLASDSLQELSFFEFGVRPENQERDGILSFLHDLPTVNRKQNHVVEEQVGLDPDVLARFTLKEKHLLFPPFDFLDELERPSAWTRRRRQLQMIADLVADQRERVVPQHRRQHFLPERARRHRPVVFIHDFEDHRVLVDMEPAVFLAFGCDYSGLGRSVGVEWLGSPRFLDLLARFFLEGFRVVVTVLGAIRSLPVRCS